MKKPNNQVAEAKAGGTAVALLSAVAAALIAGFVSYGVTKFQVEKQAAITLSFAKEQFDARLKEYPKLWQILLPISSRFPDPLTPEKAQAISQELNDWFYGSGGLVAHEDTRSLVYQLRQACANWKSGPQPKNIYELKDAIIASCRNDLFLVTRADVDTSAPALKKLTDERNEEIKEIKDKASLFKKKQN